MMLRRLVSLLWTAIITAHAFCAAAWWWLMPGGFPVTHPRFWVNQVLPWVVVAAMLFARFAHRRFASIARPAILVILPCTWIAAAISARMVFPISFRWLAAILLVAGGVLLVLWIAEFGATDLRRTGCIVGAAAGLLLGSLLPPSQKTWHVGTNPLNEESRLTADVLPVDPATITPKPGVRLYPSSGLITVTHRQLTLGLQPLLTFDSRSPDGCLVLLASRAQRIGPTRQLTGIQRQDGLTRLLFADDDTSTLTIDETGDASELKIEAISQLPDVVWSHLNTFSELTITGHRRLSIAFSPCPQIPIEAKPMDSPRGRPARFGFLDSNNRFSVVEATSAEKGPFRQLATGPLYPGQRLTLTLLDDVVPVMEIEFDDFARQADAQLSPTAGWGVPVNAIEFRLSGDEPSSPVEVFLSLASTSVGRGYESVGHAPGVYRNRVTIRRLP